MQALIQLLILSFLQREFEDFAPFIWDKPRSLKIEYRLHIDYYIIYLVHTKVIWKLINGQNVSIHGIIKYVLSILMIYFTEHFSSVDVNIQNVSQHLMVPQFFALFRLESIRKALTMMRTKNLS